MYIYLYKKVKLYHIIWNWKILSLMIFYEYRKNKNKSIFLNHIDEGASEDFLLQYCWLTQCTVTRAVIIWVCHEKIWMNACKLPLFWDMTLRNILYSGSVKNFLEFVSNSVPIEIFSLRKKSFWWKWTYSFKN